MERLCRFVLKGQWKRSWFPSFFQDVELRQDFQPLRGWLISVVAPRQKDGFYTAHPALNVEEGALRMVPRTMIANYL